MEIKKDTKEKFLQVLLELHQEWRRDRNVPAKTKIQSPVEIGVAIDYAIMFLKDYKPKPPCV